jgi:hypothetical protein
MRLFLLSHLRDFVRKNSVVVECGFYRGFSRKTGAERGVFVVMLWFYVGQTWLWGGRDFGGENFAEFWDLFSGDVLEVGVLEEGGIFEAVA